MSDCLTFNGRSFASESEFKNYVESNPEEFSRWLSPIGYDSSLTDYDVLERQFYDKARSFLLNWAERHEKDLKEPKFKKFKSDFFQFQIEQTDLTPEQWESKYKYFMGSIKAFLEYNHPEDFDEKGYEMLYDLPKDEVFQLMRRLHDVSKSTTIEFATLHDIYDPHSTYNQRHEDYTTPEAESVRDFFEDTLGIVNRLYPSKQLRAFDSSLDEVSYVIKAAQILDSDKAAQVFKAADKGGWPVEKILKELQIPQAQRELLLSFNTRNREELLTNLLANYSYAVEINTAMASETLYVRPRREFNGEDYDTLYEVINSQGEVKYITNTEKEALQKSQELNKPVQYYSNMTVPGGTNYTENEIRTPAITPSIKGHAAFATDKGIGWFRSDDKTPNDDSLTAAEWHDEVRKTRRILEIQSDLFQKGRDKERLTGDYRANSHAGEEIVYNGKTYTIGNVYEKGEFRLYDIFSEDGQEVKGVKFTELKPITEISLKKENQFLQLLNKDNNWVSFFVKSIIQDSAKKGYEKILFPTGDTAAKVEGHQTLAGFIRQKEERLKIINRSLDGISTKEGPIINKYGIDLDDFIAAGINNGRTNEQILQDIKKHFIGSDGEWLHFNYDYGNQWSPEFYGDENPYQDKTSKESFYKYIESNNIDLYIITSDSFGGLIVEKEQIEKELKDAQEGNLKISSIAKFYEDTIKNILDKRGYKPERIKDEHGNEWYQVDIKAEHQQPLTLDSSLSELAEGLKAAGQDQIRFEAQIERLIKEAEIIQGKVKKIDDETLRTRMRDALRYVQDPKKKADLKNFVYFVLESSEVLKHYVTQLKKLPTIEAVDERIALIEKAKIVSTNFTNLITFLKKDFRYVEDSNEFKKLVNQLSDNYEQIQTIYASEAELAMINAMTNELSEDVKIATKKLQAKKDNAVKQVQRAKDAGSSEKFIAKLEKDVADIDQEIIKLIPTAETLEETAQGLRGDLSWLTANFRSTLAMGDPILSGYARRLKEGFNKVRRALMPIRDEAQSQLEAYSRTLGVRPSQSMAKFYEGLYEVQDLADDKDGEIKSEKFYSLLAPVNQKFYNDELVFRDKIQKLKKADNDPIALDLAEKEYQNWLNKYAERRYAEAWYDRYNLLTPEASIARQDILDEINNILRGPNRDSLSDSDVDRLGELKYKQKRLSSTRNDNGQLKTGADLAIAQSIQAFNKKTAEMAYWETTDENRRWFKIILDKKKDQLTNGLITQADFDRWFSANTQRNISPEFYKARQVIIDKIQYYMSKLPKAEFKDDVKALWTSILDTSRPYRDEDNILEGTEFKPEEVAVVRSDEEKLEDLKEKIIRFSGLNIKQEQELSGLWANLDTLDEQEIARFMELREQKDSYKNYLSQYISQMELNQLMMAFGELSDISKWVTTDYYNATFDQKLHEFRVAEDPNFIQDLSAITEKFKNESQWYKDNHITKTVKRFVDEKTYFDTADEPLYIWKDIIPTNEKWVEEDAPGFSFKTRIVKPEFINARYGQLNYEYFRTTDPEEYKSVPKRIVNENGTVGQSSYINQAYEALRNNSSKDQASKAKWDMLQFLTRTHLDGQQKLPKFKRLGYFLPGIVKDNYDRVLEKGVKGIKENVVNKWAKVTQTDKDLTLGDTTQIELSVIPVKYSTKVKPEEQDLNLLDGVLKHRASVEEYEYLESELPTANVIQSALRTAPKDIPQSQIDGVLKKMGLSKFIRGTKESTRSKTFEQFIRTMFYGEMETTNLGNGLVNKLVNNVFGLASLQVMTFNFPAHVTNLLSGEIQNVIEAAGGKYMTFKDYGKAKAIYAANIHNFWDDYTKEGKKTFWSTLADRLDVPQGEFLDHFGRKTNFSRLRTLKSHVMIIKSGGEHEMQVSTMIAMALNRKVKMGDKMVSLNEALDLKDGKIVIRPGAELTEADLNSFQNKVQSVVRALNGAYSKIDRSVAEKSFLGKLAFFMRKYMIPMAYRRYEGFKYDYEEQDFKEGYYRTAWHILKDIVRLNTDIVKNWDIYSSTLTAEEKANMRRFFAEAMIIGLLAVTILMVGGYDRDRDLKGRWGYTMALYQLLKMKSEAETFVPLPGLGFNEMSSLFSSPFVPATAVKNITRMAGDFANTVVGSSSARFKRDYGVWHEGDLRIKADALKLLGINSNLATPENLVKNFELRNR